VTSIATFITCSTASILTAGKTFAVLCQLPHLVCGLHNLFVRHTATNCGYYWQPYFGWWGPYRRTSSRSHDCVSFPFSCFTQGSYLLTPCVSLSSIVFLLFSSSLLGTHVHLLMHNASTVEWYGFQRMRQRERLLLGEMFPPCVGGPCGDRRDHPFGEYHETGAFVPPPVAPSTLSLTSLFTQPTRTTRAGRTTGAVTPTRRRTKTRGIHAKRGMRNGVR